jgi:3-dehydroquinate dehydratase-2
MSKSIYVLNGPNLNLLGRREPHIYGHTTLADVEAACRARAKALGHELVFRQSNYEGQIVEWIHEAIDAASGIVINPAALTHTSVAVHDALRNVKCPIIELHISNPHQREAFRHLSYVTPVATAMMSGFGADGYALAIDGMDLLIRKARAKA